VTPRPLQRKRHTKKELADKVGISPQHLHAILSGKNRASIDTADRLASEVDSSPLPWVRGEFASLQAIMDRYLYGDEEDA